MAEAGREGGGAMRKSLKGAEVVCPYWRRESGQGICCEGWLRGTTVTTKFHSEEEKLAYMRRRCKHMEGWRCCAVAAMAERKYKK